MFKVSQADDSFARVQHGKSVTPGIVSTEKLKSWIKANSGYDEDIGEWQFSDDDLGDFNSIGMDDFDVLFDEVKQYLESLGVEVTK